MPLPPDPKSFDDPIWQRIVQAAIKCRSWASQWGPPPGKKGCLVPPELITDELVRALQPVAGGVTSKQGWRTPRLSFNRFATAGWRRRGLVSTEVQVTEQDKTW